MPAVKKGRKSVKLILWRYAPKTEEWVPFRTETVFCAIRKNRIEVEKENRIVPLKFSLRDGEQIHRLSCENQNYVYSVDLETLGEYRPE